MLIIKKGEIPSPYRLHKCPYCGTKFIYNVDEDVKYTPIILDCNKFVECPFCKNHNIISGLIFRDKTVSYEDYEKYKKELKNEGGKK